jgi:hypothetical protein
MTQIDTTKAQEPVTTETAAAETSEMLKLMGKQAVYSPPTASQLAESIIPNSALAKAYAQSRLWGKATEQEILVKFMIGEELGIPKITALRKVFVFTDKEGRVCTGMEADLMRALFLQRAQGSHLQFIKLDADGCTIRAWRHGVAPHDYSYTAADAARAGLLKKPTYACHPTRMFLARCTSLVVNAIAPDVLMGCNLTPDEAAEIAQVPSDETRKALDDFLSANPNKDAPQPPPETTPPAQDNLAAGRAAFKAAVLALAERDLAGLDITDTDIVGVWATVPLDIKAKGHGEAAAWIREHASLGTVEGSQGEVLGIKATIK